VEFYEAQVRDVLELTRAAGHGFRLDATEKRLIVMVEMSERLFAKALSSPEQTKREIESELLARLGIEAEVQFVQPTSPQP
jgi:phenylacetate-coenzyme A ligase PaaK-like adenylate-forming protein